MKNLMKALMAAFAVITMAQTAVAAETPQDIARDKEGRAIMDARGNCVNTKWETTSDMCGVLNISRAERTVYFDFNKSTIKASEKAKLDSLIRTIKSSSVQVTDVDVIGHADKIGASSYNQKLSRKRAQAVKSYLQKKGGIKTRLIDVRALGDSQPVTACDPKLPRKELIACLAEDRRVEIMLNYAK